MLARKLKGIYKPTGAVSTLSYITSATVGSGPTITIPGTAQAGDLAVFIDWAVNSSGTPTLVVPSGWTSIQSNNNISTIRRVCSAKIIATGEPGTSITGMDGGLGELKTILIFRGNIALTSFTAYSAAGALTTADPAGQTVTSSGGSTPLVVIGSGSSTGVMTAQVSFTPAADGIVDVTVSSNRYQSTGYKIYNSSPANVTVDMADYGSNGLQSFYLSVT